MFRQIVAAADERHFTANDSPLLISFVQATLSARKLAGHVSHDEAWHRAVRLQASLATKLRFTVQSRTDPKTIGRRLPEHDGPQPWETEED